MRLMGGVLAVALIIGTCADAEARSGKGRSFGFISRAKAAETAPAARGPSTINVIVRPRVGRGSSSTTAAAGSVPLLSGLGLPDYPDTPTGSVASAKERPAYPSCPSERLFGTGVGFCAIH